MQLPPYRGGRGERLLFPMLHTIALTMLPGLTPSQLLQLLRHSDSAEAVLMHPDTELSDLNDSQRAHIVKTICDGREKALQEAVKELKFCTDHMIQVLPYNHPDYPHRLRECPDAPAILYYRGTAPLNAQHIVAVVGTRKITEYGKQMCARLTEELQLLLPDCLVVSGLAYGVDIHTHRGCMKQGLTTVGVMAHGLDQIYPAVHRNDASRMVNHGGILTEYPRGTRPLQGNFLRRNRIVAGMSDCTIVVESAAHGGSLVTARIALSYGRTVFAVPGRVNDPYSAGCNNLLRSMKATAVTCGEDIARDMGWWEQTTAYLNTPHELTMFGPQDFAQPCALPQEQQQILQALQGTDGLRPAQIAERTGLTSTDVATLLFEMEMTELVKVIPGNMYVPAR